MAALRAPEPAVAARLITRRMEASFTKFGVAAGSVLGRATAPLHGAVRVFGGHLRAGVGSMALSVRELPRTLRMNLPGFVRSIKEMPASLARGGSAMVGAAKAAASAVASFPGAVAGGVKAGAGAVGGAVLRGADAFERGAFLAADKLGAGMSAAHGLFLKGASAAASAVTSLPKQFAAAGATLVVTMRGLPAKIRAAVSGIGTGIGGMVRGKPGFLRGAEEQLAHSTRAWRGFGHLGTTLKIGVLSAFRNIWAGLRGFGAGFWTILKGGFGAFWGALKGGVGLLGRGGMGFIRTLITGFLRIRPLLAALGKFSLIGAIIFGAIEAFRGFRENIDGARDRILALWERIQIMVEPITDAVSSLFKWLSKTFGGGGTVDDFFKTVFVTAFEFLVWAVERVLFYAKVIGGFLGAITADPVGAWRKGMGRVWSDVVQGTEADIQRTRERHAQERKAQEIADKDKDRKEEKEKRHYDFRGSHFNITQKFAEGFDPDRIALAFASDLASMGDRKIASGFAHPATGR